MPRMRWGRIGAVAYVVTVVTLAAIAWGYDHNGFNPVEAVALVLSLPTLVPALPAVYFFGALAFNATGAPDNGPMWPVSITFAVLLGSCATANLMLGRRLVNNVRSRRQLVRSGRVGSGFDYQVRTDPPG